MTSPSSMHETGHSKLVHWDDPKGWDGKGGGRGVQDGGTHVHLWLIHVAVWQRPPQYCKVISLQLKINNFKSKIKKKTLKFLFFFLRSASVPFTFLPTLKTNFLVHLSVVLYVLNSGLKTTFDNLNKPPCFARAARCSLLFSSEST